MKKVKDLLFIALIYLVAYAIGFVSCYWIENEILRMFVFDVFATAVTFIFSIILVNSSVYDAYWSLTPMIISIWLFVGHKAFSFWNVLFLIAFNVWSLRLTVNWISVFSDFSYEDWRYTKFRDENGPFMWFVINFFGIHYVPTFVVFAGMLPLFELSTKTMNAMSLPGILIILAGTMLEFFADRNMHDFLAKTKEKKTCTEGLWNYSRHPNYLGEISVWTGTFLAMLPVAPEKWYYIIGCVLVCILFNAVSIPLMEKRQLTRRPDYNEYRRTTSRLLLLPKKKQ